jgi:hypothetical protein
MKKTDYEKLVDRWNIISKYDSNNHSLVVDMYDGKVWIGYELQRMYLTIQNAIRDFATHIILSTSEIKIMRDKIIIEQWREPTLAADVDGKREYISTILQEDELVRKYVTMIDEGDRFILKITQPAGGETS